MRVARAAAILLVAAACGGDGEDLPPSLRGTSLSPITEGRAHVKLTGDLRSTFDVRLDRGAPNIFQPPDGGFALAWAGEDGEGLAIGGDLFEGSRDTGEALSLSITATVDDLPVVLTSTRAECGITVQVVERDRIEGTFDGFGLAARGLEADATGVFAAATEQAPAGG